MVIGDVIGGSVLALPAYLICTINGGVDEKPWYEVISRRERPPICVRLCCSPLEVFTFTIIAGHFVRLFFVALLLGD